MRKRWIGKSSCVEVGNKTVHLRLHSRIEESDLLRIVEEESAGTRSRLVRSRQKWWWWWWCDCCWLKLDIEPVDLEMVDKDNEKNDLPVMKRKKVYCGSAAAFHHLDQKLGKEL